MNQSDQKLQIADQKTVIFYDDELVAVRAESGDVYVSIRQMCDALQLNLSGQLQRIQRTAVLEKGYRSGDIQTGGGRREVKLLKLNVVPLWLATISTKSIKSDELRERLEKYQTEAAQVLWEAFQTGRLTTAPEIDDLLDSNSPAAQAYKMAMAMAELARNQLQLEARLATRLDDHETRLEQLEAALPSPKGHITEDQAMQISQSVKTVALALGKRTKKNEFGAVYGELYRKFGITSYKMLPAKKFEAAINFLTEWHQNVAGDAPF
jgi:hypothetical protein